MIRFSRREDYAIVIVSTLARAYNKRLVPLSEIANEYAISPLFLRNLANELRDARIIKGVEGKLGGYFLTKDPAEVKMGEVLGIFFKKKHLICCPATVNENHHRICPKEKYCIAGNTWRALNKEFVDKVYSLSLTAFLDYKPKNH